MSSITFYACQLRHRIIALGSCPLKQEKNRSYIVKKFIYVGFYIYVCNYLITFTGTLFLQYGHELLCSVLSFHPEGLLMFFVGLVC